MNKVKTNIEWLKYPVKQLYNTQKSNKNVKNYYYPLLEQKIQFEGTNVLNKGVVDCMEQNYLIVIYSC